MPLILRGRVAWAHDWVSNPALNASFESLPGTSFTVFGAPIPHDSALTSVNVDRSGYQRLVDLGWLNAFSTNISDVHYQVTERGKAAAARS